jgi:hypothetical protein
MSFTDFYDWPFFQKKIAKIGRVKAESADFKSGTAVERVLRNNSDQAKT